MKSLCLSLAALALVASPVLAQGRGGRGGAGGPAMYLNAKSVQEELKISADDAKAITDKLSAKMRELGQDAKPEERAEATKKILAEGLKADQVKRLQQIMWQKGSLAQALNNTEVQSALKLKDEQKEKIKGIQDESRKAMADLRAGGGRPDQAKVAEMQKKTTEDINAVLSDEQKKAWKDLQGPEFKGEIPRGGRPGGRTDR